jgi:hypothetical protein
LNYLKYIERAPENLQFFLWFKDYEKRFNNLPGSEKVLSQEWTEAQAETERKEYRARMKDGSDANNATAKEIFEGTDFDSKAKSAEPQNVDPCTFDEPAEASPPGSQPRDTMSTSDVSSFRPTTGLRSVLSAQTQAESAFEEVGLNKPCKLIS